MSENKGIFRKLLDHYNDLCKDLGVENGACRGCVPVVKFDPETEKSEGLQTKNDSEQKNNTAQL